MGKEEEKDKDRAWFLEKELQNLKEYHGDERKVEHVDWKESEKASERQEREHQKNYSKERARNEGGVEHHNRADVKIGGVRGKPHPASKMDRKGRMKKS
ncbi:MAG: hypothetical protein IMF07_05665 [Proteobacteria bacterium]|nr:hypothetical protein [Pseudomonadota bacterium]